MYLADQLDPRGTERHDIFLAQIVSAVTNGLNGIGHILRCVHGRRRPRAPKVLSPEDVMIRYCEPLQKAKQPEDNRLAVANLRLNLHAAYLDYQRKIGAL